MMYAEIVQIAIENGWTVHDPIVDGGHPNDMVLRYLVNHRWITVHIFHDQHGVIDEVFVNWPDHRPEQQIPPSTILTFLRERQL